MNLITELKRIGLFILLVVCIIGGFGLLERCVKVKNVVVLENAEYKLVKIIRE